MRTTSDYIALIEPQHADKPKFVATVALLSDALSKTQSLLASLPQAFDVDFAIGVQLDAVGVRVGRSRLIPYPLQGIYFSLDDPVRGLDRGIWKGPYDTGLGIYRLDDDTFRRLLKSKILANTWDGTIGDEQAIFDVYFADPETRVFVYDSTVSTVAENYFSLDDPVRGLDQGVWAPLSGFVLIAPPADMRMTIGIAGRIPSLEDLAILDQGLIGAKPEGVTVDYAITSSDGSPVFGLDVDNPFVGGLDHGAWGVAPSYLMAHAPT